MGCFFICRFTHKLFNSQILNIVKNKPHIMQNKIKDEINCKDGRLVSSVVHYLENIKRIKRKKVGKSYSLEIL